MPREKHERNCRKNHPKDIYTRVKITGKITGTTALPKPKIKIINRNKLCKSAAFLYRELKFIFYSQVVNKKEIVDGELIFYPLVMTKIFKKNFSSQNRKMYTPIE